MNSRFEDTTFKQNHVLRYQDKLITLDRPLIMAITNLTDDSFYSASRVGNIKALLNRIEILIKEGADILDLGAMSSRPGASIISADLELSKILPAVQLIQKEFPDVLISIDTFRSEVANEALATGAGIINDISGYQIDPLLPDVIAKHQAIYILMHMKGTFETMHTLHCGENYLQEIGNYFFAKIRDLRNKGVNDIVIDPGFGFSKTMEQNFGLIKNLSFFQHFQLPVLVGISRKSMIYKTLGVNAEDALAGTIALNTIALKNGASILRVHDVKAAKDAILMHQLAG